MKAVDNKTLRKTDAQESVVESAPDSHARKVVVMGGPDGQPIVVESKPFASHTSGTTDTAHGRQKK